jgi:hypothetical protein
VDKSKFATEQKLLAHFNTMFGCDTARIIRPGGVMFLIVGHKMRSEGQWFYSRDGGPRDPFNFDYVEEKVVASGRTLRDLAVAAERYKRSLGMTMEEYNANINACGVPKATSRGE